MPTKIKPIATKEETIIPKDVPSLELVELTVNSFKGIDRDKPVVIDFREQKKGENITVVKGDQGVGKSSTIEAILYACGESFDFKLDNLVNLKDESINVKLEFKKDKRSYQVLASKTKFELKKLFVDSEDRTSTQWVPQSSPKELLKELIGHIATSPMFLKEEKRGEKQVEWLFSLLNVPEATKKEQQRLTNLLATTTEARKNANKDAERIKAALSENELYVNWEASEKKYKEQKSLASIKQKINEIDGRRQQYTTAVNGLASLKKDVKRKNEEIADLEEKIASLKKSKAADEKRIVAGEKFIQENKDVLTEYDAAYKEFEGVNTYVIEQEKWKRTVTLASEMTQYEDSVIYLDTQKDEIKKSIKDLLKSILPPIEGLEVETEKSIDQKREVGIYINGKTPAQLSESELVSFYLQVCRTQKVSMIVVENISSFGSFTIDVINSLAAEGVKVFGTLMDRNIKDRAISFTEKID